MPLKQRVEKTLKAEGKRPITKRLLIKKADIKRRDVKELGSLLEEMIKSGEIILERNGYLLSSNVELYPATVVKINNTFGFVRLDNSTEDTFVAGRFLQGSMPDDRVLVKKVHGRGNSPEGQVVKVIDAKEQEFTGTLVRKDGHAYVLADRYIKTPLEVIKTPNFVLKDGQKVLAKIVSRGPRHFNHRVKILDTFGTAQDASSSCKAILRCNDINTKFSKETLEQAQFLQNRGITDKEFSHRLNLTDETIFTIDGADSKDLDDAISLEKHEDGWYLGVHIADVSHYVKFNSDIDKDAYDKGTSIYYADSVIPMLPESLSNGICSLNPDENRLAFSALISLDNHGNIIGYNFAKTIIRSRVKGVYGEVNKILDGTASEETNKKYSSVNNMIFRMKELADILNAKRKSRGGFDLDSQESKIILDDDKHIIDIVPRDRGESERIIEEFMLTANEAAASLAMKADIPFVYRIHENPPEKKIDSLRQVMASIGFDTNKIKTDMDQNAFADFIKEAKGTKYQKIVNEQVLRTMAKARYDHKNIGHFGLTLDNYSHFTSPIRRYPDLIIHRILSAYVGKMDKNKIDKIYGRYVAKACVHCSECELRAMMIERQCDDCYKAEFMKKEIGKVFDGVISSAAPHGIYVELANTVEGMVHISKLPHGYYEFDGKISVVEKNSGRKYTVGDAIKIKVSGVDVSGGKIDFEVPED